MNISRVISINNEHVHMHAYVTYFFLYMKNEKFWHVIFDKCDLFSVKSMFSNYNKSIEFLEL